MFTDLEPVPK